MCAEHLTKRFRTKVKQEGFRGSIRSLVSPEYTDVEAVSDISLTVERGEILAFIGPNGAGKSTTIKMLTGILFPTSGRARVVGLDPVRERKALAFRIGTVFGQKSQLWYHLPAADSFRLLSAVYELDEKSFRDRLGMLTELFDLQELLKIPIRKLSLGQRVRCEIAASLLHRPEVVFLDEPTIGLDVLAKQKIRDLIIRLNKEEGTTIFLTSHDTGDIEQLCDRAVMINRGRIVLDDTVKHLKYNYLSRKIVSVKYAEPIVVDIPGVATLKSREYAAKIEVDTKKVGIQQVVNELMRLGSVLDITISDLPLDSVIASIYSTYSSNTASAGGPKPQAEEGGKHVVAAKG